MNLLRSIFAILLLSFVTSAAFAMSDKAVQPSFIDGGSELSDFYTLVFNNEAGFTSTLYISTLSAVGNYDICTLVGNRDSCSLVSAGHGVTAFTMEELGIPNGTALMVVNPADTTTLGSSMLVMQNAAGAFAVLEPIITEPFNFALLAEQAKASE